MNITPFTDEYQLLRSSIADPRVERGNHLRDILRHNNVRVITSPELGIPGAWSRFDSEGRLRVRDVVWTPLALVEATGVDPIVEQLESITREASAAPPASGDATGDGETPPVGS